MYKQVCFGQVLISGAQKKQAPENPNACFCLELSVKVGREFLQTVF